MSGSRIQSDPERDAWLDTLIEKMGKPSPEEEEFFRKRREQLLGVGLDEKGKLVRAD